MWPSIPEALQFSSVFRRYLCARGGPYALHPPHPPRPPPPPPRPMLPLKRFQCWSDRLTLQRSVRIALRNEDRKKVIGSNPVRVVRDLSHIPRVGSTMLDPIGRLVTTQANFIHFAEVALRQSRVWDLSDRPKTLLTVISVGDSL